ncbi:MAG: hypothetical protein B5M53_10210 [Candidatus Cloacimonas sp. 4484_209]|nr:MAG: hypothetical protein B5M53_10210 [Candidatus Cloacimonas sp. 4484_209]
MGSIIKIVFIDPPSLSGSHSEDLRDKPVTPNMGLIYLATYLHSRFKEVNVNLIDMVANNYNYQDVLKIVKNINPHIVGITSKTFNILMAYKIAEGLKSLSKEIVILVGGAHPTALPEETLSECVHIDAVVRREGELTIGEIVERFSKGCRSYDLFEGVKGVTFRNRDGGITAEPDRELIPNLDSLPFPDFSLVDYKKYDKVYNSVRNRFEHRYPIFSSRGCPFNCTFCMPLLTRRYRIRAPEGVVEEVSYLNKRWGTQQIYFEDSLFGLKRKWFEDFCEMYIKKGLHRLVQWGFEIRIDTAYPLMFEKAKEAGCIYIFFGVESGSELVLRKANKKYTKDQIFQIIKSAKDAGIAEIFASFIFGLPYETMETVQETLDLLEMLPIDNAAINILDVYPGTETFRMADTGQGGLQWIEGKRMNWDSYSRCEPQVKVNDLSPQDLIQIREKALKVLAKKRKRVNFAYAKKAINYFFYLLQTNPKRLLRYMGKSFKGHK